ncbi:MAG: COG1470 family protein [Candidatus Heimdallarchaeota archaeon]
MKKRKGLSHLVAAIILVAITLIGGIIAYSFASGTLFTQFKKTEVAFEYLGLYKSGGEPKIIFAGTIKNIGAKPIVKIIVQLHNESEYLLSKVSESSPLEPGKCVGFALTEPDIHADWYIIGNAYSVRVYAEAADKGSFAHTTTVRCLGTGGPGSEQVTAKAMVVFDAVFGQEGTTETISGPVLVIDEGTAAQMDVLYSDLPLAMNWSVGSVHTFKWVSPVSGLSQNYYWVSTSGLSDKQEGFIIVPSDGGWVIAEYTGVQGKALSEVIFDARNVLFSSGLRASEDYVEVDESTFDGPGRKIIYAEGLFWAFYIDPPAKLVYRTSEGGDLWALAPWSNPTTIKTFEFGNPSVAVSYDGKFIHLVWAALKEVHYIRGRLHSDGSISWGPENVLETLGYSEEHLTVTSAAVDSSGKLWVGYSYFYEVYPDVGTYYAYCLQAKIDSLGRAEVEFRKYLAESDDYPLEVVVVPMFHGRVMVFYYGYCWFPWFGHRLFAKLWTGTEWGQTRTFPCDLISGGFSAAFDGKQLHLLSYEEATIWDYIWNEETSNWGRNLIVVDGVPPSKVQVCFAPATNQLYAFWTASAGVYYSSFNGTAWSEPTPWLPVGRDGLSTNSRADDGKIGVLCWEGNTVYFGFIAQEAGDPVVLKIDGENYTLNDLPVSKLWEVTSEHSFEWVSPFYVGTTSPGYYGENIWVSTEGLSTDRAGNITVPLEGGQIIANYTQKWKYRLLVGTSPYGKGVTSPEAGEYIFDPGETVTVQFVSAPSEYSFMYWLLDGFDVEPELSIQIEMNQPHILIAYLEQKDFRVSVANVIRITQGETVQEEVSVEPLAGHPGQVSLSIPDAPTWLSYSFTPNNVAPDFDSTLTLSVSEDAPIGWHLLTIKAESPVITRTVQFHLCVNPIPTSGITFYAEGVIHQTPGVILTVDGVDYTMADLPVSFDWPVGSSHTFAWHDPLTYGDNYKFFWESTSGLSDKKAGTVEVTQENGKVVGHYKAHIALVFKERGLYLTSETDFLQGQTILTIDGMDLTFEQLRSGYVYWVEKGSTHTIKWHKISTTFTYTMDCLVNGVPYEDQPFTCHFWNPKEDEEQTIRPSSPKEIVGTYYTVFKYCGIAISINDFNLTILAPKMDLLKVGAEWYTTNNIDPRIYLQDWLHPIPFSVGRVLYYRYGDTAISEADSWELPAGEWVYHEAYVYCRDVNKIIFWINDWGVMTGVRNMAIVGVPYWADNY